MHRDSEKVEFGQLVHPPTWMKGVVHKNINPTITKFPSISCCFLILAVYWVISSNKRVSTTWKPDSGQTGAVL